MDKKKIVVLTGAGVSAESGISTFRDADGLWEGHDIMEVASPEGFAKNPKLVHQFYNDRRRQLHEVEPNAAHRALVRLEEKYEVVVITQNVDDLHERAGSSNIIHLHGELRKARCTVQSDHIVEWDGDLSEKDLSPAGHPMRPHIVWFGEAVPMIERAAIEVSDAHYIIIIGTSMQVYPAAGLISYAALDSLSYYIDPKPHISYELERNPNLTVIAQKASIGVPQLVEELMG